MSGMLEIQGSFDTSDHASVQGGARVWPGVAGRIEKRLQRGARGRSVGWLERVLSSFGDRERRDQQ